MATCWMLDDWFNSPGTPGESGETGSRGRHVRHFTLRNDAHSVGHGKPAPIDEQLINSFSQDMVVNVNEPTSKWAGEHPNKD